MYYNPLYTIINASKSIYIGDNIIGGANKIFIPDNKSIIRILHKRSFTKKKTKYDSNKLKIDNATFYNIYDMRDFIANGKKTINDFIDLLMKDRFSLLVGDSILRPGNRKEIFSQTSYPILITFKMNPKLKYVVENPEQMLNEAKQISEDTVYAYKQIGTYVVSVSPSSVIIDSIKYIDNSKNKIKLVNVNKDKEITINEDYNPILIEDLNTIVKELNITPLGITQ
ncbi:ORF MSV158 putative core protein VP8 homolog (vaccinia L4R), similar to GB:X76267 [Melanoplus sanguinipes entomopoxvirus]|uniref:ORF MSV158 putative core protein VP8 homolog (Vaccinia L4R), similar to GB:X76267 n=1 Tax=Melanoplus sanguinipes entomopoxvirus TaxID=83191 RepID=Q9YVT4_MSEPV|nr:ORF MSV158 putative core protein VP8 homolog (vaccinia L4R), similar to GB:X76267 [Melanoplus sanguinipes entomopoxvirus]AAC97781.1 ORF MSV158 putative core protein VP8 homolog (vaccinia L4R), similar to GB:X76267 [Melanoplus sanguinipes entomopoxvirus 'O']